LEKRGSRETEATGMGPGLSKEQRGNFMFNLVPRVSHLAPGGGKMRNSGNEVALC